VTVVGRSSLVVGRISGRLLQSRFFQYPGLRLV
jgi:hypothetical protein